MTYDYNNSLNGLRTIAALYKAGYSGGRMKGFNFMTSDVAAYIRVGCANVELSFGKGLTDKAIYGVTVTNDYGQANNLLCRCFHNLTHVQHYLSLIKEVTEYGQ